jgi:hypothetical protein
MLSFFIMTALEQGSSLCLFICLQTYRTHLSNNWRSGPKKTESLKILGPKSYFSPIAHLPAGWFVPTPLSHSPHLREETLRQPNDSFLRGQGWKKRGHCSRQHDDLCGSPMSSSRPAAASSTGSLAVRGEDVARTKFEVGSVVPIYWISCYKRFG